MEYTAPVNRAIGYIGNRLGEPIAIEDVAAAAGYSRFHFDRLFLAVVGDTASRYIRKRRLSEAARQLVTSNKRILDIALDCQFQSQEAFTRAFRRAFGISPGAYRKRGRLARLFPRITLKRPRIFCLDEERGVAPGIALLGRGAGKVRPARAYVVLAYRKPVDGPRRAFDVLHLSFRWGPARTCAK
jgi:AraC-like DNA-binding protein